MCVKVRSSKLISISLIDAALFVCFHCRQYSIKKHLSAISIGCQHLHTVRSCNVSVEQIQTKVTSSSTGYLSKFFQGETAGDQSRRHKGRRSQLPKRCGKENTLKSPQSLLKDHFLIVCLLCFISTLCIMILKFWGICIGDIVPYINIPRALLLLILIETLFFRAVKDGGGGGAKHQPWGITNLQQALKYILCWTS